MEEELTPLNSGFRSDTVLEVTLTGKDFSILMGSNQELFNANVQHVRPIRWRYYDKDGEYIPSPTKEQFESGELLRDFDALAFMSANNLISAFVGDLTPATIEATKILTEIQNKAIKDGKAVKFETLFAEQQEKNKSKLEVIEKD